MPPTRLLSLATAAALLLAFQPGCKDKKKRDREDDDEDRAEEVCGKLLELKEKAGRKVDDDDQKDCERKVEKDLDRCSNASEIAECIEEADSRREGKRCFRKCERKRKDKRAKKRSSRPDPESICDAAASLEGKEPSRSESRKCREAVSKMLDDCKKPSEFGECVEEATKKRDIRRCLKLCK